MLSLIVAGIGQIPGTLFRRRIDRGLTALLVSLIVPLIAAVGTSLFLWYPFRLEPERDHYGSA